MSQGWEEIAGDWLAWTRRDGYPEYRDRFFALVPPPGRRTLEVGCGEGRVARDLAARGHAVTAVDASPTLLAAAAAAHPDGEYVLARAEELPFPEASFDLVVAHMVLMDVDDMRQAVREIGRVLVPGGRFCAGVTHPMADSGAWEDERFVIAGCYLDRGAIDVTVEREGVRMRFAGSTYPLQDYSRALEDAGLAIEALREPAAAEGRWARVPNFLYWRAVKR